MLGWQLALVSGQCSRAHNGLWSAVTVSHYSDHLLLIVGTADGGNWLLLLLLHQRGVAGDDYVTEG